MAASHGDILRIPGGNNDAKQKDSMLMEIQEYGWSQGKFLEALFTLSLASEHTQKWSPSWEHRES
jgi:hypothetical protein